MGNGTDRNAAYDENGNIKAMLQSGWQMGGSHPIDSLNYTYYTNSNKLKNVIDGRNDPLTTMGDFRTSSLSPYNTGKTTAATDYTYDPNGNLTRDLNKDIGSQTTDGIIYNHLNLPWQVKVRSATGTKGTITYIYDATGNKLKKTTLDSAGSVQTVTTYIGAFQYQGRQAISGSTPADTLQFFGQEEGRVRVATDTTGGQRRTSFKYDYFLKDHLGNTRMVLTDEQQMDLYPAATMEVGDSATENLYYSKLDSVRTGIPVGYPTDTTTNPNNYVARLNGSGVKIGPGITLKVMAGDQFSIRASSWYKLNGTSPGAPVNPLPDLLGALISGVGGLPGGHPTPAVLQANSTPLSSNITEFLSDTGSAIMQTKPHAFINWVLFDNQFNYVAASSGFDQVGGDQEFKKHVLTNLPVTTSGYLYIYTSNETPNINVFFDNLQVTHTRGPLLEEDHYYPFGLTMAGISDKALKDNYAENKYRFNGGNELQSKEFSDGSGLEAYDATFRMYDPQIGRFWQIDPLGELAEDWSPYSFAADNPILLNDPLGLVNDSAATSLLAPGKVPVQPPKCLTCDAPKPDVASAAGPAPANTPAPIDNKTKSVPWMDRIGYDLATTHGITEGLDPTMTIAGNALRYTGISESPVTCAWCAAYGSSTIHNSGFSQPKSASSASWLRSKDLLKTGPYYGAIAIFQDYSDPKFKNRTGSGHIGFLFGLARDGKYIILGGNQGNTIKFSEFGRRGSYIKGLGYMQLEGFYFPIDYYGPRQIAPIYQSATLLNRIFGIISNSSTTR